MSKENQKKKKRSYGETLGDLPELMEEQQKDLEEQRKDLEEQKKDLEARELQLKYDREKFEKERSASYGNTKPSDVLDLNIGGTRVSVLRRTLTAIPDSMLATKFSGRWDDSLEKDRNGNFFIDQEYDMFRYVIKYLRNKENGVPRKSPEIYNDERFSSTEFFRMIEYYGLTNWLYPVELKHHGHIKVFKSITSRRLNIEEFATFSLLPEGHSRRIKTYEIILGAVQQLQIGWRCYDAALNNLNDNGGIGAGNVSGTFALDIVRSRVLFESKSTSVDRLERSVDRLEHSEGTVVRSESFGKVWHVNGSRVASDLFEINWAGFDYRQRCQNYSRHQYTPLISVKGDIEVSSVEFVD